MIKVILQFDQEIEAIVQAPREWSLANLHSTMCGEMKSTFNKWEIEDAPFDYGYTDTLQEVAVNMEHAHGREMDGTITMSLGNDERLPEYYDFADKGEILNEICRNAFDTLAEQHRRTLAEDAPPLARLRRIVENYMAFGFANPNAYRLAYLTPQVHTRHGAETVAQQSGADLFRAFVSVVEEAVDQGALRGDPRTLAQVIWASAHGLVSIMTTKPYFDWADRETLVRTQMDALFAGLTAS